MKQQLDVSQTARDVDTLLIEAGFIQAANKRTGEPAPFLQGSPKLFVINAIHGDVEHAVGGGENEAHRTPLDAARFLISIVGPKTPDAAPAEEVVAYTPAAEPEPTLPDPRDEELAKLRARVAELEASPPPSPAVVALEGMEALKAKIDAGRATDEDDFAGVFPTWLIAEEREGESLADRIARLTRKFRARVNELTNKLLAGEITPEEEAERDSLMDQYNTLAELGDRS